MPFSHRLHIRPLRLTGNGSDLAWAEALLDREVAGRRQARLGVIVDVLDGTGLVAEGDDRRPDGLVTWTIAGSDSGADEAELRVLVVDEAVRGRGVGTALLAAAEARLGAVAVRRAWLVTTNDNVDALAFYQRRGWQLAGLRPGAVDEARRTLKPSIPDVGAGGIPIRDELVLAKPLGRTPARARPVLRSRGRR